MYFHHSNCRRYLSLSVILSIPTYFKSAPLFWGKKADCLFFSLLFLKTAGCLSPLFLNLQVVLLSCSYASRSSSVIPKTAGVSFYFSGSSFLFSVILLTIPYFSLSFWWQHVVFLSFILKTEDFPSLPYFLDHGWSFSLYSENSRLICSLLFLRQQSCLSLPLLPRQQVVFVRWFCTDGSFAAFIFFVSRYCSLFLRYAYGNRRYSSKNILSCLLHWTCLCACVSTPGEQWPLHTENPCTTRSPRLKVVDKCFDVEQLVTREAHLSPLQLVFV